MSISVKDLEDHGQTLVKALTNLIIPVVTAHCPGANITHHTPVLEAEAHLLLDCLKRFVVALVRPSSPSPQEAVKFRPGEKILEVPGPDEAMDIDSPVLVSPKLPGAAAVDKPPLLKLALGKLQQNIFNKMPIRLLEYDPAIKPDGIKLVERSEISRRISNQLENDFVRREAHLKNEIYAEARGLTHKFPAAEETVISKFCSGYGKYAILSHTWLQSSPGEVTYSDWRNRSFDRTSYGYQKLQNFCRTAATDHKLTLSWMDTICINKESSSELDESIRSMYNWYRSAAVCITYLAETTTTQNMSNDAWFTRGWTLQELIAPLSMKFYNNDWDKLVPGKAEDKTNPLILNGIHEATSITTVELETPLSETLISRRMQWAANRRVTREEDKAYALMGIFDVSISIAYGEGAERAFVRLLKEILNTNTSNVLDIMNWGYGDKPPLDRNRAIRSSALLPPSPEQYLRRAKNLDIQWPRPTKPITWTQLGLPLSVLLMPSIMSASSSSTMFIPQGNYHASITNIAMFRPGDDFKSSKYSFNLLAKSIYNTPSYGLPPDVTVFAVLNIIDNSDTVEIPVGGLCYAVPLSIKPPLVGGVIAERFDSTPHMTVDAVVFELKTHNTKSFVITKRDLIRHGITFRTMYL